MSRIVLGVLAVFAVALSLAAKFLPWWGMPLVLIGLLALLKYAGTALFRRFAMGLFSAKSAALKGASLAVRSVTPVPAPPAEEYWDEEEKREFAAQRFFAVELTITPRADGEGFSFWEPGELRFARPGSTFDDDSEEAGELRSVEIWSDGRFGDDEAGKYGGAQTLRLTVGVRERVTKATLRYYFEDLGTVDFGAAR